jgi:hypothetical protein
MKRSLLPVASIALVAGTMLACPVSSAAQEDADPGAWVRMRTENGIVVSRKDIPGSRFLAFRGEGDVDEPLLLVGSVLVDIARDREWVDSLVESKILRTVSETEYITYSHIGTPITMSDRDFVTDVTLQVDATVKRLAIEMHSVSDVNAPTTKYVRGELMHSSFSLTSIDGGRRTHVVAEIHCDPKGSIAAWFVNKFQNDWGFNTIRSLRAQVRKPDVSVHPRLKAVLEEKGFFN